jgi:hypothetical protein
MRRHILSRADVAAPSQSSATVSSCPSRYASIRTFGEPALSVTRCIMGSVFSDYREGAAIFGSVSAPEDGG